MLIASCLLLLLCVAWSAERLVTDRRRRGIWSLLLGLSLGLAVLYWAASPHFYGQDHENFSYTWWLYLKIADVYQAARKFFRGH
jgi:hypothetical protein